MISYTFEVRPTSGVEAVHYVRRETRADTQIHGRSAFDFPHGVTEEFDEVVKDCMIQKDINALSGSGAHVSKLITEFVQNAADTTFEHFGLSTTGGWGEGLKMANAQLLKRNVRTEIVVSAVDCEPCTSVSLNGRALCIQNVHPSKRFDDKSVYIGHSTKRITSSTSADMKEQMQLLLSPQMSSVRRNELIVDTSGVSFCTTVLMDFSATTVSDLEICMAWLHTFLNRLRGLSYEVDAMYCAFESTEAVVHVHTFINKVAGTLHTCQYQNGLFIERVSVSCKNMSGYCVVSITACLSMTCTRDRTFAYDNFACLKDVTQPGDICEDIFIDFFFNKCFLSDFSTFFFPENRHPLVFLFVVLKSLFPKEVATLWQKDLVPVSSEKDEIVDIFGSTLKFVVAPPMFAFFDLKNLVDFSQFAVNEEASVLWEETVKVLNDTCSSLRSWQIKTMTFTEKQCRSLDKLGLFAAKSLRYVTRGAAFCSGVFYVSADFVVNTANVHRMMMSAGVLTSDHLLQMLKGAMYVNDSVKKIDEQNGVSSSANRPIVITPHDVMASKYTINEVFGHPAGFVGNASDVFVAYELLLDDSSIITLVKKRNTGRFASVHVGKCKNLQYCMTYPFPETILPDPKHVPLIHNVQKFALNSLYRFQDVNHAPTLANLVRAFAFTVGRCGYVTSHKFEDLDNPNRPTNCMAASIRFSLLLRSIGCDTWIMMNQKHAFLAVDGIFPCVTYIECTVSSPADVLILADELTRCLLEEKKWSHSLRFPHKYFDGTMIDCFCKRELSLVDPSDQSTANCSVCNRLFHLACADHRMEENGHYVCLVCKPSNCTCGVFLDVDHQFRNGRIERRTTSMDHVECQRCFRLLHKPCAVVQDKVFFCVDCTDACTQNVRSGNKRLRGE